MQIRKLHPASPEWERTAAFAGACSWRAGVYLVKLMRENRFAEWERVFAAFEHDKPVGFCTLTAKDEMPENCDYTPFIGFVFVDEAHRGNRISAEMIAAVCEYAKSLGYEKIYLTSDEQGLYEKYGFAKIGTAENSRGEMTQLFEMALCNTETAQAQSVGICTECGSAFLQSASKMRGLCPECASRLYGYKNCAHEFRNGKCVKCLWDGSQSVFIKLLEEKHGTA